MQSARGLRFVGGEDNDAVVVVANLREDWAPSKLELFRPDPSSEQT